MANTSPRHMPVLGNVHTIKIENIDIFRDVISLLARVFIFLIDRATQEVPMENIWNKWLVQFLRYTSLHFMLDVYWRGMASLTYVKLTYREYVYNSL